MVKNVRQDDRQARLLRTKPELMKDSMMLQAFSDYVEKEEHTIREIFSSKENVVALIEILQKEDWRQMRAYLTVLREYLPLLDAKKQMIILDFLSDMLAHQSGMVRRIAARTYGYLLARRQMQYGIAPDKDIQKVLFPGNAVSSSERRKINYQLRYVLFGFRETADEESRKRLLNHYAGYFKSSRWDKVTCFYLIMGIIDVECEEWSSLQKFHIFSFLRNNLNDDNEEVRLAALYLLYTWLEQGWKISEEIGRVLLSLTADEQAKYCEKYLIEKIHKQASIQFGNETVSNWGTASPSRLDIMQLFQENQHSHALWINKILNLSILKENFFILKDKEEGKYSYDYLYANHLLNMIRLNKQAVVFLQAGRDLMEVMPYLESYQKFEIVKDILQSLENIDDYYNFVAPFAASAFLTLEPSDQLELIPRLWELTDRTDSAVVNTTLEVVAKIMKSFYPYMEEHQKKTPGEKETLKKVNDNLCSIISTGMASYKPRIARESFFLTGHDIFSHVELTGPEAYATLIRLAKKALISLGRKKAYADDFYNYAAIKEIRNCLKKHEEVIINKKSSRKIAFFSGSFDPFSRGHKAIAREVAEMGYTVFLDAHDFSWYKKLQPMEIRRQIIYLSISDLDNVMLFPDEYPISIENPEDLGFLRSLFPDSQVTIVTGSDVIETCEAYWKEPEENSIHTFPHIIFQRGPGISRDLVEPLLQEEAVFLRVPSYFDSMTSEEIQKQIALGRDISDMVDRQVRNYVLDKKIYRSEPIYKKIARTREVSFLPEEELPAEKISAIPWIGAAKTEPDRSSDKENRIFMEEIIQNQKRIVSAVSWHETSASDLYEDCHSLDKTQHLRKYVSGKVLVITGLYGEEDNDACMIICNELLARYQLREFSYAICLDPEPPIADILKRFGFVPAMDGCMYTDLRHPVTMFYDADSFIKEPWYQEELIQDAINCGKRRLMDMLPGLYPGNLILHFDASVLNYRMIRLITEANHVADHQTVPVEEDGMPLTYESFGEKMCVPFGKLLKGVLIPNTVTKELYVEKLYESDLHTFDISEFPDYESLTTQIRTVKAFKRPAVFVDDLYHKGYRMQRIRKLLEEEGVSIDRFMVGVLSGQGKDLARENGLEVEAPYFVPDMRAWLVESDLYPFVGGDGIISDEDKNEEISGLPSINLILPYQIPKFLEGSTLSMIYQLSETALLNARDIFLALEKLYQQKNYHSLTFGRIGEVMAEPRYPEGSIDIRHNEQLISDLLSGELAKLERLKAIMLFDHK